MNDLTTFKQNNNLALMPKSELPWEPKEAWTRLFLYYFLILAFLITLQHGFGDLTAIFLPSPDIRNTQIMIANVQGSIIGFTGIGLTYMFLKYDDKSFSHIGVKLRENMQPLLYIAIGVTTLALAVAYIVEIGSGVVSLDQILNDRFKIESNLNEFILFIFRFLIVFGGVAIGEEIIFRGYIFRLLDAHLSTFNAALGSSILFGLLHFFILSANRTQVLQTMITVAISAITFGMVFSYAYVISGKNIVFPILIHGIWNNIIFFFNTKYDYETPYLMIMEILSQLIAALIIVFILSKLKDRIKSNQES
jgi:membrane protease YdiL (CAAX protease family)